MLITETFKGRQKGFAADQGNTAIRIFQVVGAPDESTAVDGVSTQFGVGINSAFDDTWSYILCQSVFARLVSPNLMEVIATYAVPPNGLWTPTTSPLLLPWKVGWKTVVDTIPFDRDINGNPVVNSCYDPPKSAPTKTITYKELTITRYELFYDYATYKQYENCVNSDTIELTEPNGNTNIFEPGTVKCISIEPVQEYNTTDVYVLIRLTFHVYDLTQLDIQFPFQLHILDEGGATFYGDGTHKGNIVNADGSQPTQDVCLNGQGKPIDTSLMVSPSSSGGPPQAPVNSQLGTPQGATIENAGNGSGSSNSSFPAVYLRYDRYYKIALTPILVSPAAG